MCIPIPPAAWNIGPKPFRPRKQPNGNNQTAKRISAWMRKIRPRHRHTSLGWGFSETSSSMRFKFLMLGYVRHATHSDCAVPRHYLGKTWVLGWTTFDLTTNTLKTGFCVVAYKRSAPGCFWSPRSQSRSAVQLAKAVSREYLLCLKLELVNCTNLHNTLMPMQAVGASICSEGSDF